MAARGAILPRLSASVIGYLSARGKKGKVVINLPLISYVSPARAFAKLSERN
jgi:hypothetical protein